MPIPLFYSGDRLSRRNHNTFTGAHFAETAVVDFDWRPSERLGERSCDVRAGFVLTCAGAAGRLQTRQLWLSFSAAKVERGRRCLLQQTVSLLVVSDKGRRVSWLGSEHPETVSGWGCFGGRPSKREWQLLL